jgi:sulfur-oxidizing protein SoxY
MNTKRRDVLRTGSSITLMTLVAAAGWLRPGEALAADWNKARVRDQLDGRHDEGARRKRARAKQGHHVLPDARHRGERRARSRGRDERDSKTESIAILVEKNPNMLAAVFDIPPGTDPSLSTRIKLGQSSNVFAVVKADGKYYVAGKEIKVTLGGCGG